ncbi:MAG: hypothetical protein GX344_01870 [Intrasporangiaceae bacterium]|nr:hypothetical protein [Intrasporangiaceae bacterium]
MKTPRLLAAAAGAALLLSGCGTANTAAVVEGHRITESGVIETVDQVNMLTTQPVDAGAVLSQLIIEPTVAEVLAERGVTVSDASARSAAASVGSPTPYLLDIIKLSLGIGQLTEDERIEAIERIKDLDISVSPRFGTFDPERGVITAETADWIADPAQ